MLKNIKKFLNAPLLQKQDNIVPYFTSPTQNRADCNFYDYLNTQGFSDLSAYTALQFYSRTAPVFNAVDMIAQEVGRIPISLWDKRKQQHVYEHDILYRLSNPNTDMTQYEFFYQLVTFYLVTGNAYVIAKGTYNMPPVELEVVPSSMVGVQEDYEDGYPKVFELSTNSKTLRFQRDKKQLEYKFRAGDGLELMQIKTFNPTPSRFKLYGASKLSAIYGEIEQYIDANTHNSALLKNGGALGIVLSTENELTESQYAQLQSMLDNYYSSPSNAGRALIAENGLKVNNLGYTNKDMDFNRLKTDLKDTIYNVLRIPLPMVSRDALTYANLKTSVTAMYNNAVIPIFDRVISELNLHLMPRYDKSGRYTLTYNQNNINALVLERMENLKTKQQIGVSTINELRADLGEEHLPYGDVVLVPTSNTPLEAMIENATKPVVDVPPVDTLLMPAPDAPATTAEKAKFKTLLHTNLLNQKDSTGKPLYDEQQIEKIISRYDHYYDSGF